MSGRYEDLEVWQFGMELVYAMYDLTATFPKHETYGLMSQMRRAAVSIPSNIAEGKGCVTDKEFAMFLCHARGSVHELQTQILIARHLGYISNVAADDLKAQADRIGRMLNGLIPFTSSKQESETGAAT